MLQYENMKTAEYFASSAEESTLLMQQWTEQMHAKTMSMHVITVFTLVFLPGTFVAVSYKGRGGKVIANVEDISDSI